MHPGACKTISHTASKREAVEQRKRSAGDGCCINHARSISARSEEMWCGGGGGREEGGRKGRGEGVRRSRQVKWSEKCPHERELASCGVLSRSAFARGAKEKSILLERRQGQIIGGGWRRRRAAGGGGTMKVPLQTTEGRFPGKLQRFDIWASELKATIVITLNSVQISSAQTTHPTSQHNP